MRFGPWQPLADAARAPAAPGVFQVKLATGLLEYPRGKSAMIHYGAADDLRRALGELAAAHPERGATWLWRVPEEQTPREATDPGAILAELVERFRRRFGSAPRLPEEAT